MTDKEIQEIREFIAQRFNVVEVTPTAPAPEGRYIHVSEFGRAIHYIIQLLAERHAKN